MKHLVVGANGIIGSALFSRLQKNGASVFGTSKRTETVSQENIFAFNLLQPPSHWVFANQSFDVAYLCAGICRMALCEEDPQGTSKINIDGMISLAKHLADQGAFIIFLSTNQVFSGESPQVSEEGAYQPLNEYGRQKAVVEQYIREHCPRSAIVRLTKVIEPNMPLIQQWIEKLKRHEPVEAFCDMMLAPVALRQVLDVLVKVGETRRPGCYQVSGAKDISYLELAHYLAARLGCPASLVRPMSAIDKGIKKTFLPRFTTLSCSSTIALCEQKPPSFLEVVQECFEMNALKDA